MNIVERAGRQLGLSTGKSLIEKAAERLASTEPGAVPAREIPVRRDTAQQEHVPATSIEPRETRQRIIIDFDRLRAGGFALPDDQSGLAEEMRLIKRPLLSAAFSNGASVDHPNVIMVTSTTADEGKTFTATNLAFSVASEHEMQVLLIDADVANPTIPDVLGFDAELGLMDLVLDSAIDLTDVLIRTNIPNLTILPCGRSRSGASELLASSRMARFVDDIAKRYSNRLIIFDAPPIRARSEPLILAQYVGQVVFVIEAERTSRLAATEALGSLGANKLGGIVLNKTPPTALNGYGYYYGTGSR